MRLERRTLTEDPAALARSCAGWWPAPRRVADAVVEDRRATSAPGRRGARALPTRARRGRRRPGAAARVARASSRRRSRASIPTCAAALELAIANVRAVAEAGLDEEREMSLPQGQRVALREVPVARAAVYVPGGRAPYPSTVVMGAVTARAAGVREVVVCAARSDGDAARDPRRLRARGRRRGLPHGRRAGDRRARLRDRDVRPVDVIVGPGNLWVQEAKRQVARRRRDRRLRRAERPARRARRRRGRGARRARPARPGASTARTASSSRSRPTATLLDALAAALAATRRGGAVAVLVADGRPRRRARACGGVRARAPPADRRPAPRRSRRA